MLAYVDDLLIVDEDDDEIARLGRVLTQEFETKDLGYVSYYLGVRIERKEDDSFLLDQNSKVLAILDKFGMVNAKDAIIAMDPTYLKLDGEHDLLPDNGPYREAVGH